jgi:hypothetical protein
MDATPVIITIFFFLTIAVIWGGAILTRHKERMALIEKSPQPDLVKSLYDRHQGRSNPLAALKWGIVFFAVGAAILVAMYIRETYMVEEGVYPAMIALFGGLALVVFYFIAARKIRD